MSAGEWAGLVLSALAFITGQGWLIARVIARRFATIEKRSSAELNKVRAELMERVRRNETGLQALGVDHTKLAQAVAVMQASVPTMERIESVLDRRLDSLETRLDRLTLGLMRRGGTHQDDGA